MKRAKTSTNCVKTSFVDLLGKGVCNEPENADQYNRSSCAKTAFAYRVTGCLTGALASFARCGCHRGSCKRALSDADDVDVQACSRSRPHPL